MQDKGQPTGGANERPNQRAKSDWSQKKVTVLGLGRSGLATARYLRAAGAQVLISESAQVKGREAELADLAKIGVQVETGGHSDAAVKDTDLIVTSPGIPPTAEVIVKAQAAGKEVICDIELAWRELSIPMIAITGTNGKSTTCALVAHLLRTAGYKAVACGNIGVPILSCLEEFPDYLVVEVSSFQLHYCPSFRPQVAVWLNLTPDHLEWHGGLAAYRQAKEKLFANLAEDSFAVLNDVDPAVRECPTKAEIFPFSAEQDLDSSIQAAFVDEGLLMYRVDGFTNVLCSPDQLQIIGKHNIENALAAVSACACLRVPADKILEGLKSFPPLEHRLEYVATIHGVRFFNDSKGTNPASTVKALEAFGDEKIVLIAGGRDKGTDLTELVDAIKKHANAVIVLGEAADRFQENFQKAGIASVHKVASMEEAVEYGLNLGKGPVVLSPACASFDMFKDYEERGRVFKNLVHTRLEKIAPRR